MSLDYTLNTYNTYDELKEDYPDLAELLAEEELDDLTNYYVYPTTEDFVNHELEIYIPCLAEDPPAGFPHPIYFIDIDEYFDALERNWDDSCHIYDESSGVVCQYE